MMCVILIRLTWKGEGMVNFPFLTGGSDSSRKYFLTTSWLEGVLGVLVRSTVTLGIVSGDGTIEVFWVGVLSEAS